MTRNQRADGIRRLRALFDPVLDAFLVDLHDGGFGARVVVPENFDERAVAGGTGIGDDDAEERALFGTGTAQTNSYHLSLLKWRLALDPIACFAVAGRPCLWCPPSGGP